MKGSYFQMRLYGCLVIIGSVLTLIGGVSMALGIVGVIDLDAFAFGGSAGIRILGTVAITGCLLGAIGCFGLEVSNVPS